MQERTRSAGILGTGRFGPGDLFPADESTMLQYKWNYNLVIVDAEQIYSYPNASYLDRILHVKNHSHLRNVTEWSHQQPSMTRASMMLQHSRTVFYRGSKATVQT